MAIYEPVIASCGMGTNSIAYLVDMIEAGERIDEILFADTGGEHPHTYLYLDIFNAWLASRGRAPVTVLVKGGLPYNLEQNCKRLNMLPSLAYGYKSCSHKYKIEPQEKFCNNYPAAKVAWKAGGKVVKLIGYDIDEPHRAAIPEDKKYRYRYPLLERGWGREECLARIEAAGLPAPGKSACFFCPSSTKADIKNLWINYPDLFRRAVTMEIRAKLTKNLKTVQGLGRRLSWWEFYKAELKAEQARARNAPTNLVPLFEIEPPMPCGCYDG